MNSFESPKSTIVRKVWYNPDTEVLSVLLADKNIGRKTVNKKLRPKGYIFVDVPKRVFVNFSRARSKGHYFTKNIRDSFRFQLDVFCSSNPIDIKSMKYVDIHF